MYISIPFCQINCLQECQSCYIIRLLLKGVNMSSISYKDLVNDLSNVLISFIEPMNLKFFFADRETSLKEIFMKSGFMPLFLYDKQPFIDYALRHKKIDKFDNDAFATLHFQEDPNSYFNLKIDLIHNLFNEDILITENSTVVYDSLLYSLATKILSEKDFFIEGNKVFLDEKYSTFINEFQHNSIQEVVEETKVKGGTV